MTYIDIVQRFDSLTCIQKSPLPNYLRDFLERAKIALF